MFERLFSWRYSGSLVPTFAVLAGLLWGLAVVVFPFELFFAAAAVCLVIAFVWSLGWLWTHDSRRSRRAYIETYSADYPMNRKERSERRKAQGRKRRNKKWRVAGAFASIAIFSLASMRMLGSYRLEASSKDPEKLEVFLADSSRTRAMNVSFQGIPSYAKDMIFSLSGIPIKTVKLLRGENSIKINVIVINTSAINIHHAHIRINSNVPIRPGSSELMVVSDTELGKELDQMPPFSESSQEYVYPLEIPIPAYESRAGLLVTVEGDQVRPFAATGRIMVMKQIEPTAPLPPISSVAVDAPRR